jgi:hypothetical protein
MSVWEFRQQLESSIPLWFPVTILFAILITLLWVHFWWHMGRNAAKREKK